MSKVLKLRLLVFGILLSILSIKSMAKAIVVPFLGKAHTWNVDDRFSVAVGHSISDSAIAQFEREVQKSDYQSLISELLDVKKSQSLNDWLFYQLIRNTAQQLSPKSENYYRYTLYKWFLLNASGYQATLSVHSDCLLFYVWSDENVYGMPFFVRDNKQFICINYHDYGMVNFEKEKPVEVTTRLSGGTQAFSYKVTQIPELNVADYTSKELQFNYKDKVYHFSIKLNPQVKALFKNYPVSDFETYFNIPLSRETYTSLIPPLKENVALMSEANGIDYLMRFTRNAFLYESDQNQFGQEKRLSPEQTLLYEHSDCDDRAGLFFYLVKEIYNKPMIVLLYPTHVTVAIQLDNPIGKPIFYEGKAYTVCEPTPQYSDLSLGEMASHLKKKSYEIVYVHNPIK